MGCEMHASKEEIGVFFNIQHFSVHDGPGIRTMLFAKGCPLHCLWCSNPESQKFEPEVAYKRSICIGAEKCGLCIETCSKGALSEAEDGGVAVDRRLCDNCGHCIEVCPANALAFFGREYDVKELVNRVDEDGNYYWRSGGGPTIGGGEPFAQPRFVGNLLETLKSKGYNTAVETCGYFDLEDPNIKKALSNLDFIFYDIKHMDPVKHKAYTGQSNERILGNILKLSRGYPKIEIVARTPVIPGFNEDRKSVV